MVDFNNHDLCIFQQELNDFLPEKIFDCHVHVFEKASFSGEIPPTDFRQKFGGEFTFEMCDQYLGTLLPNRKIAYNSFGLPDRVTNRNLADRYVGAHCDNINRFGMALTSPYDVLDQLSKRVKDNHLIGYKPYWNMVDNRKPGEITIFDMFSQDSLEWANQEKLAITLHIPRSGRLADPVNQKDMVEICRRYPGIKFIFAHIGRAYYLSNVVGFLEGVAQMSNAWIDTAMVNHEGVLEYAFHAFPRDRILFGSDAPIAFLRGKSIEVNNQYAYLMGENYAIGSTIFDTLSTLKYATFYYEQLRGLKLAMNRARLSGKEIENIFYNNSNRLFTGIKSND